MSLLILCLVIIVIGVLLGLAVKYVPMHPAARAALVVVVVGFLIVYVLRAIGVWDDVTRLHV